MKIDKLFNKPKIIGVCGDINTGKSMFLYDLLEKLKDYEFDLYSYGLRVDLGEQKIYSIEELENIENSIIIADEFFSLFDLDNRKQRKMIENTLRLLFHNNNILILCGLPENFKKFISAKLDVVFFKKCSLADFVNGSRLKNMCLSYKGSELGSSVLNIKIDDVLCYDSLHYHQEKVKYTDKFDTKIRNKAIIKRSEKCAKSVPNNVEKIKCAKSGRKNVPENVQK